MSSFVIVVTCERVLRYHNGVFLLGYSCNLDDVLLLWLGCGKFITLSVRQWEEASDLLM